MRHLFCVGCQACQAMAKMQSNRTRRQRAANAPSVAYSIKAKRDYTQIGKTSVKTILPQRVEVAVAGLGCHFQQAA